MRTNFGPGVRQGSISPLSFGTPAIWTRSDDPDASINTAPDPDTFSAIPNKGSIGGSIVPGNQPNVSLLKKRRSAEYDGAVDGLIDNWADAPNRFLHDGTGCTVFAVINRTTDSTNDRVFGTFNGAGSQTGILFEGRSSAGMRYRIGNSTVLIVDETIAAIAPELTTRVFWMKHQAGASPEYAVGFDATTSSTGSYGSSVDTGDASQAFQVGGVPVGSIPFIGHIPELIAYPHYMTDANIQNLINKYLHPKWV